MEKVLIENVKVLVKEIMSQDNTGHGYDHIERVYRLATKFCEQENANKDIVALASLLHDVDDYKLFGEKNAKNLTNAKQILSIINVDENTTTKVLDIIHTMGYSKCMQGIRPNTLEGKIVSDADMCDAVGAYGILRTYSFSTSHNGIFFDKNIWPNIDMGFKEYKNSTATTSICHVFEKLLKLKSLMMTESGKAEAKERHNITIEFVRHIFMEENVPEWNDYLDKYLENQDK